MCNWRRGLDSYTGLSIISLGLVLIAVIGLKMSHLYEREQVPAAAPTDER